MAQRCYGVLPRHRDGDDFAIPALVPQAQPLLERVLVRSVDAALAAREPAAPRIEA
jgi:hypothetical protein